MNKLNRLEIQKMLELVRGLDIMTNPEPAAIFDPLIQGFNVWAIPSDHPGGDWEKVVDKMDAGAYTKRSEYVGCAFYNLDGYISVSSDAYALRDHLPEEYYAYLHPKTARLCGDKRKSIHNRPDDIAWVIAKVEWVFEKIGIPCPEIVVEDE